ncbi:MULTISPECIES: hypothetical protein [Paenarthrobacter]|jgi:hypothetical protein|uniref:hypothetical protein n=1 Tax=Paenarthrobacter TaxID=1742992 RepID=UPI00222EBF84|nr:hypothetical protein [Paenarthrobacter sp. PAE-2]MCW3767361.1 hypothetical protein [Paenarthrobacter sp. PAE-2]
MSQVMLSSDRRSHIRRAIFAIDLLVLLAPPVHWFFSDGRNAMSVWYFLGANALVTLSLFALWMTSNKDEETIR